MMTCQVKVAKLNWWHGEDRKNGLDDGDGDVTKLIQLDTISSCVHFICTIPRKLERVAVNCDAIKMKAGTTHCSEHAKARKEKASTKEGTPKVHFNTDHFSQSSTVNPENLLGISCIEHDCFCCSLACQSL